MPTVFVTKLAQKVSQEDLEELFARAGRVRDVRLVLDKATQKHKGAAYVEFDTRDALIAAVRLSGSVLCGVEVQVRAWVDGAQTDWQGSQSGRAGAADTEQEAGDDGACVTVGWSSRPPMRRVDGANHMGGLAGDGAEAEGNGRHRGAGTTGHDNRMLSIDELKKILNPNQLPITPYVKGTSAWIGKDVSLINADGGGAASKLVDRVPLPVAPGIESATLIYVSGLPKLATNERLREVFLDYGEVVCCNIESDAKGRGNGIGVVEFASSASARQALGGGGRLVDGRKVVVHARRGDAGGEVSGEIDAGGEGGVNLDSSRRAMLMQQLSRGESVGGRAMRGDVKKLETQKTKSVCLILSNMFDPDAEADGFEKDVAVDVRDECSKTYGKVVHVYVEKESHGIVYIRFVNEEGASKACSSLNGRWFGGKQVSAGFVSDAEYVKRFPSSKKMTDL